MPAQSVEVEKRKAMALIKPVLECGGNQSAVARKLGVSPQAIQERLQRPIVKKTFAEYLNKVYPQKFIKKKIDEGLSATKVVGYLNNKVNGTEKVSDEFVEVPDFSNRHKYLTTLLQCQGYLNNGEENKTATAVIININSQSGLYSEAEAETFSSESVEV